MSIEYKKTGPHRVPLAVYLDGKYVGNIVRNGEGYRYRPKGSSHYGLTFNSIAGVKADLEGV